MLFFFLLAADDAVFSVDIECGTANGSNKLDELKLFGVCDIELPTIGLKPVSDGEAPDRPANRLLASELGKPELNDPLLLLG